MNMESNSNKRSQTCKFESPWSLATDRIGELPDVLLHHILSFLRAKQAVQTSILSKRWRYLWTSISSLDFDVRDFATDKSFKIFIHKALHLRDTGSDVVSFRVSWPWIANEELDVLMQYASDHKVELMEIDCWRPCPLFKYPSLCCSLRAFTLVRGWLGGQLDLLTTFHNLRSLHLCDTWVQAPLESLILRCPALEEFFLKSSSFVSLKIYSAKLTELTILDCSSHDGKIELSCPNLASLSYRNRCTDCSLENLYSLASAYLCCSEHKGVKFLNSLCNVKVLILDCLHLEVCTCTIMLLVYKHVYMHMHTHI